MAMTAPGGDTTRTVALGDDAAVLFHALSEPSRLSILRHLFLGEHRVVDLVAHLGLAQSTVSKHLACLRACGLVDSRPVGRSSVFTISHPERVQALLTEAGRLLAATGDAAAGHDPADGH